MQVDACRSGLATSISVIQMKDEAFVLSRRGKPT